MHHTNSKCAWQQNRFKKYDFKIIKKKFIKNLESRFAKNMLYKTKTHL